MEFIKNKNDTGEWFEDKMSKKAMPQNAFEVVEKEFKDGDIDLAERRLTDWRDKTRGDVNNMRAEGRWSCRMSAIIFLALYQKTRQGDKYYYSGIDKQGIGPLLIFAKSVIRETPELEAEIPSRGLEEFFLQRQVA